MRRVPPAIGAGGRAVREQPAADSTPIFRQPEWLERFPWAVQGTTARGAGEEPFDLGLFGAQPSGVVLARWRSLRVATGCARAVHARQVHRSSVALHGDGPPGLFVGDDADGHATRETGTLLTVSVADCVPIFALDAERRAIAALHGGWRGVAAGILESGLAALRGLAGTRPADTHIHLGPAICGECYEVGPEVHAALGLEPPPGPAPVDLRAVLVARALAAGVPDAHVTYSDYCTRCGGSPFFSHRGGDPQRQMGVLGLR